RGRNQVLKSNAKETTNQKLRFRVGTLVPKRPGFRRRLRGSISPQRSRRSQRHKAKSSGVPDGDRLSGTCYLLLGPSGFLIGFTRRAQRSRSGCRCRTSISRACARGEGSFWLLLFVI